MDFGSTLKFASFNINILSFLLLLQGLYQVFLETWNNLSASHIKTTLHHSIRFYYQKDYLALLSCPIPWILLSHFLAGPANLLNQVHCQNPIQHPSWDSRASKNFPEFTVMAPMLHQPNFKHRLVEKTIQILPTNAAMKTVYDTATEHSVLKSKKIKLSQALFHNSRWVTAGHIPNYQVLMKHITVHIHRIKPCMQLPRVRPQQQWMYVNIRPALHAQEHSIFAVIYPATSLCSHWNQCWFSYWPSWLQHPAALLTLHWFPLARNILQ